MSSLMNLHQPARSTDTESCRITDGLEKSPLQPDQKVYLGVLLIIRASGLLPFAFSPFLSRAFPLDTIPLPFKTFWGLTV